MDEDDMYAAGSDDFRGYVWKIPPLISLQGLRNEITARDWYAREWPNIVGEHIQLHVKVGRLTCVQ
jgi:WD repeat-containing protein 22